MAKDQDKRNFYIDRARYWRIVRFFGGIILQLAVVDVFLGRFAIIRRLVVNSRPRRFRRIAQNFRALSIEMGGVMIKLGQFLSARVDVLPPEVTEELQGLQDEVPAIPLPVLRRALKREYPNIADNFAEVEMQPLAAASFGQTMRAKLPDGENVVIKIQRPNIEAIVQTDLAALRTVAPWVMRYERIRKRADVPALMEEFAETLWEELDYIQEVRNVKLFTKLFADKKNVYVPKVYEELCSERAIVLENVENPKINNIEAIRAAGIDETKVADELIEVYLYQLFTHGIYHADPHPGNVFIRPVGPPVPAGSGKSRPYQIIFIDFGMIGRLPPELVQNMGQVLMGLVQKDARKIIYAYDKMGFFLPGTDLERIIEAQENIMMRLDGRNLRELSNPDPEEIKEVGMEFRDILFDFPFQVPQNFVYLGRALGILAGIASSLHPDINPWHQIEKYGIQLIAREQTNIDFSIESFTDLLQRVQPYLKLPSQIQRVVAAAESGKLRIQSHDPQALRRLDRLERRVGFLNWSVLAGAGLLSGTLIYLSRTLTGKDKK